MTDDDSLKRVYKYIYGNGVKKMLFVKTASLFITKNQTFRSTQISLKHKRK